MPRPLRIQYAGARYHVMSRAIGGLIRSGSAERLKMGSSSYISNLLGCVDSKL